MKRHYQLIISTIFICIGAMIYSCSKDDYYIDGGLAEAQFEGSIMDYLDAKPFEFDTIAEIVRISGLEEKFKEDEFTFFAPRDEDIKDLIGTLDKGGLNRELYYLGLDTIQTLEDIQPEIWEKFLLRHVFNGKLKLEDYTQIDFSLMNIYGGQNYISEGETICNIGVVFHDAVGGGSNLKYMGYRQLYISYIEDPAFPDSFRPFPVASSDIQPSNGVVHVIDYTEGEFGFSHSEVRRDVIESKR